MELDCEAIQRALWKKYKKQIGLSVFNYLIYDWESDFLRVTRNEYSIEYEVKLSRTDFKADFRKEEKHKMLRFPMKYTAHRYVYDCQDKRFTEVVFKFSIVPNKFFYICPTDVIAKAEVPDYAGLIYVNQFEQLRTIKEAPLLHKVHFPKELYKDIAQKFSSRMKYPFMDSDLKKIQEQRLEINELNRQIKALNDERKENSNDIFYLERFSQEFLTDKGKEYLSLPLAKRKEVISELRKRN